MLSTVVRSLPARVYVPHKRSITVLDQRDLTAVGRIKTPFPVRRVVPSWDLKTLWATGPGLLMPIDPRTMKAGKPVRGVKAHTLNFTPDGLSALLFAGKSLEYRNPRSMALRQKLALPCAPTGPADFSADGAFLVAACRQGLLRVDWVGGHVTATRKLKRPPTQILLSPDGTAFFVGTHNGLLMVDATDLTTRHSLRTAHPLNTLTPGRDGVSLFATGASRLSSVDMTTLQAAEPWPVPPKATLGAISSDGKVLWFYTPKGVSTFSTAGRPIRNLAISASGITLYPQPGRYCLGHTFR